MRLRRRVVPGNDRVTTAIVYQPDAFSLQAASLGAMTNTFSPGSRGGAAAPGFIAGLPGFGVNRASGESPYEMQRYREVAQPVRDPDSQRLGAGAMPSGQPGLPSTGDQTGALGWTWGLGTGMGA